MSRDLIWQALAVVAALLASLYFGWLALTALGLLAFVGFYILASLIFASLQGIVEGVIEGLLGAYRYHRQAQQ